MPRDFSSDNKNVLKNNGNVFNLYTRTIIFITPEGTTLHCVSEKVPTIKLSVTLSNLNRFLIFLLLDSLWNLLHKCLISPTTPYLCCCTTFAAKKENANKMHCFYMHPFNVTHLLTYCLLTYYFSFWFLLNILSVLFYANRSCVNSALHTGHTSLRFPTRQHLFHWTRSVTIEQPRPHSGLLQDVGCHPAASLSFNVNDSK